MRRRTRILALLAVPLLLLGLTAGVARASVIEDYARVIRSRHAGATFVKVDGCRQVEVFVSAMDGKFGTRGGPVNKQGLVGVFYAERDICVEPGPKGYPITYSADGMSLDRLVSTPQFGAAWVRATIPGQDSDGNQVSIGLDVSWSPLGAFERSRVSNNAWFPANGQRGAHVHTFSHGLRADARAGLGEPGWAGHRPGADQRRHARAGPLLLPGDPASARRLRGRLLGRRSWATLPRRTRRAPRLGYPRGARQRRAPVARDEKLDLMHRIPLFSGIDRRGLERLGMLSDEIDVPAGKVLMRQGEIGSDMMVIIGGAVAIDRDGERVNTLGAGDFFGEIALVDGGPRTATVTAEEACRLLVITHRDFHAMMEEFPEVESQVLSALAQRIRRHEPDQPH